MTRKLIALLVELLFAEVALSCDPSFVYRSQTTAFGPYAYAAPTSLYYAAPALPAYGMGYGYSRIAAPTYIAPSAYSMVGVGPGPVTIINNNNNAGGSGASSLPTGVLSVPSANINVFQGRRFRLPR